MSCCGLYNFFPTGGVGDDPPNSPARPIESPEHNILDFRDDRPQMNPFKSSNISPQKPISYVQYSTFQNTQAVYRTALPRRSFTSSQVLGMLRDCDIRGMIRQPLDSHLYPIREQDNYGKPLATSNLPESYVYIPGFTFLPYIDKINKYPQYPVYHYNKPDRQWIDHKLLQRWIRTCDTYHANHCQKSSTIGTISLIEPLWLIDVRRFCLVPAKGVHRYVSLSYVWGRSKAISTTLANLGTLQEHQALNSGLVVLPRTIKHAIGITRLLGETHLWVDRLCIVQDDERTKLTQINLMAAIYANSYFTIVAAQGNDADTGLCGIADITPPRQLARLGTEGNLLGEEPLKYQNHFEAISTQATNLTCTNWYSRGWTFQEHLFSRRKLIFHNNTVNWECHCVAWYENQLVTDNNPCNKKPPGNHTGFEITPWPNFHRYARLVSVYNQRSLTYPQDALNAFAGVISVLESAFDGGFICGLPQMFFDSALLWQPWEPLNRREVLKSQEKLPSWSWIGWQGRLDSRSWRSGYDYMKRDPDEVSGIYQEGDNTSERIAWRTKSKVRWFYSQDLDSERYRINISGKRYRKKVFNGSIDLPQGWSFIHPKLGRKSYKHISDLNQEFLYPIPLPGSFTTKPPLFQPSFIHGHTRRGSLKLGPAFTNPEATKCLSCDLIDGDGMWAGALRLNLPPTSKFDEEGSECSLIQLSFGSVHNKKNEAAYFDEWYRPYCPRKTEVYKF